MATNAEQEQISVPVGPAHRLPAPAFNGCTFHAQFYIITAYGKRMTRASNQKGVG